MIVVRLEKTLAYYDQEEAKYRQAILNEPYHHHHHHLYGSSLYSSP